MIVQFHAFSGGVDEKTFNAIRTEWQKKFLPITYSDQFEVVSSTCEPLSIGRGVRPFIVVIGKQAELRQYKGVLLEIFSSCVGVGGDSVHLVPVI